jgi:hypothetical protein
MINCNHPSHQGNHHARVQSAGWIASVNTTTKLLVRSSLATACAFGPRRILRHDYRLCQPRNTNISLMVSARAVYPRSFNLFLELFVHLVHREHHTCRISFPAERWMRRRRGLSSRPAIAGFGYKSDKRDSHTSTDSVGGREALQQGAKSGNRSCHYISVNFDLAPHRNICRHPRRVGIQTRLSFGYCRHDYFA